MIDVLLVCLVPVVLVALAFAFIGFVSKLCGE